MYKFIQNGYHRRISGAEVYLFNKKLKCDNCEKLKHHLVGYEKEYPKYPDLWICLECEKKLN